MLQLIITTRYLFAIFTFAILGLQIQAQSFSHYIVEEGELVNVASAVAPRYTTSEKSNRSLSINFSFPGMSLYEVAEAGNVFDLVRIKSFGLSGVIGSPALPMHIEKIAIPEGKEMRLSCTPGDYIELNAITIFPAQKPGTDGAFAAGAFSIDKEVYATNAFLPEINATHIETNTYRGTSIASIQVCPVQYNPYTKVLRFYTQLNINITFVDSYSKSTAPTRKASTDRTLLSNIIINPNQAVAGGISKAGTVVHPKGYLILTVPEFEEAANTLATWKQQMGYEVEIISGEDWTVSKAKDSVRNRYYNASYDLSYLLILGDQNHLPDYYYNGAEIPWDDPNADDWHIYSTNYLACMDIGWDYMPEMAHGRIPVQNTTQAMTVVSKVINYEKAPPADHDFYRKGLHAGYFQDSLRDGTSDKRYANTTIEMFDYMTFQGFNSDLILYTEPDVVPNDFTAAYSGNTTLPEQYKKVNGFAWDGNKDDIVTSLNKGCLYAWHRDHGQRWGWMQPEFHIEDLDEVHNGNELPIVFSINCGSGLFHGSEPESISFAEALIRKDDGGAVGVVAATAETHSGHNDALIIGMMDAIWPDPGFIPDLGDYHDVVGDEVADTSTSGWRDPIYTMGNVMLQGLMRMTENSGELWADQHHFHLYHYFGDPAMRIWTDVPDSISAAHQTVIGFHATSLTVTGISAEGALVTLCYNNKLQVSQQVTGGSLSMNLPEPIDESETKIVLTISKHNHIPYVANIYTETRPVVNFNSSTHSICSGDTVYFTDLTESNPNEWLWACTPGTVEFVNSTSESQNPCVVFNAAGSYNISLMAINPYGSDTLEKVDYITVNTMPSAPVGSDAIMCTYDDIPTLEVAGEQVNWYSDEELTELIVESTSYTPETVTEGNNTYYVTQTVGVCEGESTNITITKLSEVGLSVAWTATVCQYDTAEFSAWEGQIQWYSDKECQYLLAEGDDLHLTGLEPGNDTVYVTNSKNGCLSQVANLPFIVEQAPGKPEADESFIACAGDTIGIDVEGELLRWYADVTLQDMQHEGDIALFETPSPGVHHMYVTQTVDDCESLPDTVYITINPLPEFDLGNDTILYTNQSILLAGPSGGAYLWHNDNDQETYLFNATLHGAGTHNCWLSYEDLNGCTYIDTINIQVLDGDPEGITEHLKSTKFSIYPIPTQGLVSIDFNGNIPTKGTVAVTDLQGRVLILKTISEIVANDIAAVDLSDFADGVYNLIIQTPQVKQNLRVVKRR